MDSKFVSERKASNSNIPDDLTEQTQKWYQKAVSIRDIQTNNETVQARIKDWYIESETAYLVCEIPELDNEFVAEFDASISTEEESDFEKYIKEVGGYDVHELKYMKYEYPEVPAKINVSNGEIICKLVKDLNAQKKEEKYSKSNSKREDYLFLKEEKESPEENKFGKKTSFWRLLTLSIVSLIAVGVNFLIFIYFYGEESKDYKFPNVSRLEAQVSSLISIMSPMIYAFLILLIAF